MCVCVLAASIAFHSQILIFRLMISLQGSMHSHQLLSGAVHLWMKTQTPSPSLILHLIVEMWPWMQ